MKGLFWCCDRGHRNLIPPSYNRPILRQCCAWCNSGVVYRVEVNVPEDDPARMVAP